MYISVKDTNLDSSNRARTMMKARLEEIWRFKFEVVLDKEIPIRVFCVLALELLSVTGGTSRTDN